MQPTQRSDGRVGQETWSLSSIERIENRAAVMIACFEQKTLLLLYATGNYFPLMAAWSLLELGTQGFLRAGK